MGSRNKKGIARFEASKATENEGRPHGDGSGTGISAPISRRGLFAALAVAAGLGILSSTQAYALAAQNFGRGQWIGNKWVNGHISGEITHPHLQRGVNDYYFGKSTNNGAWNVTANGSQKLIAEFACVVECDWSDELYDHIVFRPFYYCASLNPNGRPLWFGAADGEDNRSYIFLNDNPVGTFQGNLINSGWSTGWLANGFYEGPGCDTFVRRQAKPHDEKVKARMDIWNVWVNGVPANKNPDDIKFRRYAPDNDMAINVERIYIENDLTLMGGIFKVTPVTAPDLRLDLIQGGYENGTPVARYENGRGTCLWHDYDGVNQNWMFWPNKSDGLGCFTFCIANMVGPNLDHGLDNRGHTSPTMDRGHAEIWRNSESTNLTNSWWVHHEPTVTNETDHKCWFITSDADGQRLDTWGITKDSTDCVAVSSPACPGVWAKQVNAQWMIEEVACHGEVGLSSDEAKPGDSLKILGWHNKFKDETRRIRPASWVLGTKNENVLPVYPIFRLYISDRAEEIAEDNAVIMASCRVGSWANGNQQTEAYSHRHIGWPHGGQPIFSLEMRLQDSNYSGSIHYAAQRWYGDAWDEGADGSKVCANGAHDTEAMGRVKVWLTGDIADRYDLVVRTKLLNGSCAWSDPVYVYNSKDKPLTLETAPACGLEPDGSSNTKISGMNVHLIRKPTGAHVVREFSIDESLTITDDFGSGYLYVAAMLGLRLPSKNTDRIWTDRYRGTVVSKPCRIESACVEYYADGIDDKSVVFTETAQPGPHTANDDATSSAIKSHCNLNDHFDEDPGMGLTGWFTNKGLTAPYGGSELSAGDELHLYARNRCTLHIEYAKGSLEPKEGAIYVSEPKDDAATVEGALELPDFTALAESHSLDGIELPAIGDNGAGHMAVYYGERISLAVPTGAYRKMEDGTWRHIVCDAYLTDTAGGGRPCKASRWSGTPRSTSGGATPIRTASPAQRGKYEPGRRCGLRPEPARVPCRRRA